MDAYTSFASVYDTFMDNIPYEEWAEYLIGLLNYNQFGYYLNQNNVLLKDFDKFYFIWRCVSKWFALDCQELNKE